MNGDERSHGLWEASAPPPLPLAPLIGDAAYDVVIVGGGFTGCSAALHLAEAGQRVALLEAVEIGFGGSGRNVGLVNAGMWVMPDELPGQLGAVYGERLLHQLGDAPRLVFEIVDRLGIACQVRRNGTLHCAVGAKGLAEIAERARQWQARGADVELLDHAATVRAVGSTAYSGSLLDRRAGTIQPLAYARGLARGAHEAGAALFTRSPVTKVEDLGREWRLTTPGGTATAPFVIVATDAYSSNVWPGLKTEQVMLPYFNMATAPLPPAARAAILPGGQGVWDTKQVLSSFRFDAAGRLVFGSVGALRGTGATIHRNWGRRELARLFPQLADVAFDYEWYGRIGMTDNALPRLHRHGRNVYSFSGYNGRGIAPGTTFGRDLARLALGEVAEEDLSLPLSGVDEPSLRIAKEAFYEVGAQVAHFTGARFQTVSPKRI